MKLNYIKHNKYRIVRKFIWFPTILNREIKWLVFANIKQQYHTWQEFAPNSPCQAGIYHWKSISWRN